MGRHNLQRQADCAGSIPHPKPIGDLFAEFFFFNDTATTEIYTLSLHDALPISSTPTASVMTPCSRCEAAPSTALPRRHRSEEHTSELQSRVDISYAVFCLK